MVDTAVFTVVKDIVTIVGIISGVSYYIMSVRNQQRAQEAQVLLQLNQTFLNKDMIKDWAQFLNMNFENLQDLYEKTSPSTNMDGYLQRSRVWRLLTTLGLIIQKGLVSSETVYDTLSGTYIIQMWDRDGPLI